MPLPLNSPLNASSYLHTIPEASSDVGGVGAGFEAVPSAASAGFSTSMKNINPNTHPNTSLNLNSRQQQQQVPPPPPSVASSTRAVEAGHGGGSEVASDIPSDADAVVSGASPQAKGRTHTRTRMAEQYSAHSSAGGASSSSADAAIPASKRRRSRLTDVANRKKVGLVCFLTLLLVIGVVVAMVFIIRSIDRNHHVGGSSNLNNTQMQNGGNSETTGGSGDNNSTDPNSAADTAASFSPDQRPTPSPTMQSMARTESPTRPSDDDWPHDGNELIIKLDEAMVQLYTSQYSTWTLPVMSQEVFNNPQSPRYQARQWLLNNDTYFTDYNAEEVTLEQITQRYIMSVFFFATLPNATEEDDSSSLDDAQDNATDNGNVNRRWVRHRRLGNNYYEDDSINNSDPDADSKRTFRQYQRNGKFIINETIHECYWINNACGQDDTSSSDSNGNSESARIDGSAEIIYLNISHSDLEGTIPFELGYLTALREMVIHGNDFYGNIPETLFLQLQRLYVLDLSQNDFEGTIPQTLWTLPILRFAYLHGNDFTGTIPQTLSDLPSDDLEHIWLFENELSGTIPSWMTTQLPSLKILNIRNNLWTGSLPEDWSGSTKLDFLDVSDNNLTGTLPRTLLYDVPSLRFLYLEYNQLSGTLPMRLPTTTRSSDNDFREDAFPDGLFELRSQLKLEALWLQYNQFEGTIPRGFGWEWSRLRELELQGNQLSGKWPCLQVDDNNGKVNTYDFWPRPQELSVNCERSEFSDSDETGVDMGSCRACCIVCR